MKIGPSEEEFIQMWHRLAEESRTDDTNDDDDEQHVGRRNEEFHIPIDEQHCTATGSQNKKLFMGILEEFAGQTQDITMIALSNHFDGGI